MKNIQPLDVMPMLGSGPSSPTSLKTKLIGMGGTSIAIPSGPVTNIPFEGMISSEITPFSSSS